jgi:hypothetical protein
VEGGARWNAECGMNVEGKASAASVLEQSSL